MTNSADPRALLRSALLQASQVIESTKPDQMELPTPCSEFDVRMLTGHMLFAARRIGEAGRRDEMTTDAKAVIGDVPDEGLALAFRSATAQANAAWAAPDSLDGEIALPFGTFPAGVVASIYVIEHVTHAWDLARAVSSGVILDDELAEAALAFAAEMIPAEARGDGPDLPFAAPVAVTADAPAYDRLAGFMGRDPSAG